MNLGCQIKSYRQQKKLSQEELGEKVYVTRQTISNWENNKSYPDIHSLLLLSEIFGVSLDVLIKGDVGQMKKVVDESSKNRFKQVSNWYIIFLLLIIIAPLPLYHFLGWIGIGLTIVVFIIGMVMADKVEKLKKEEDVKSYREILAFMNGERLDELAAAKEKGKAPYQTALYVWGGLMVSIVVNLIFIKVFHWL